MLAVGEDGGHVERSAHEGRVARRRLEDAALHCLGARAYAQDPEEPETLKPAPNRRADEGKGPFKTLVIRGAMLIDGTGAPAQGPVDIVLENNRIREIRSVGYPKVAIREAARPAKGWLGLDPASASAPCVATLVDVSGLLIYFTVASILLSGTLL